MGPREKLWGSTSLLHREQRSTYAPLCGVGRLDAQLCPFALPTWPGRLDAQTHLLSSGQLDAQQMQGLPWASCSFVELMPVSVMRTWAERRQTFYLTRSQRLGRLSHREKRLTMDRTVTPEPHPRCPGILAGHQAPTHRTKFRRGPAKFCRGGVGGRGSRPDLWAPGCPRPSTSPITLSSATINQRCRSTSARTHDAADNA